MSKISQFSLKLINFFPYFMSQNLIFKESVPLKRVANSQLPWKRVQRIDSSTLNSWIDATLALSQNISTRSKRPQVCSEVSQSRRRTDVLLSLSGVLLSSNCHIPIHNNKQLSAASTQNSSNVCRFIVWDPKISVHSSFYSCPHEFSKNIIMCDLTFSNGGVFRFGLEK